MFCYSIAMPLDIGIGLVLGVLLNSVSGINYQLCLIVGVVACLLPDLDFVWQLIVGKYSYKKSHRDGLHYPIIFTPLVGLIGLLINPYVGAAFATGALLHFFHDSIGIGWGVKWLFPFRSTSYAFLYRAQLVAENEMPKRLFFRWTDEQRDKEMAKYADPHWIKHIYFSAHIYGLVEYFVLIAGILFAVAQWN